MKRIIIIFTVLLIAVLQCSCNTDEQLDNNRVEDSAELNIIIDGTKMQLNPITQDDSLDRTEISLELIYNRIANYEQKNNEYAVCLVTMDNLDFSEVPIEKDAYDAAYCNITIDKILESTTAFGLSEKDTLRVTNGAALWNRNENVLTGYTHFNLYPMLQEHAQYIVSIIYDEDGEFYYCLNYTIPIVDDTLTTKYLESCDNVYNGFESSRYISDTFIIKFMGEEVLPTDVVEKYSDVDFDKYVFDKDALK